MPKTIWARRILLPEQLEAIGCLTVETSRLEGWVLGAIKEVCGLDDEKLQIFVGGQLLGKKIDMLQKVMKGLLHQGSAEHGQFADLIQKTRGLLEQRNTVVHGDWIVDPNWNSVRPSGNVTVSRRAGSLPVVRAADIMKIARGLAACRRDLKRLYARLPASQTPSPNRP